jgi:PLP dependent protein
MTDMISEENFRKNLEVLKGLIDNSCTEAGRNTKDVSILPVTKNWPFTAIDYAYSAGFRRVGENRVQEALAKQSDTEKIEIKWDLIGHLQSNKVKLVAGRFDRIQTIDSLNLLSKLDNALNRVESEASILIQVNTGKDPAKSGVAEEMCGELIEHALQCSRVKVEGLMTIAPFFPEDPTVARNAFSRLRLLRDKMESDYDVTLKELSMGMSGDLDEAIKEGSTIIRVGSALFGKRV